MTNTQKALELIGTFTTGDTKKAGQACLYGNKRGKH